MFPVCEIVAETEQIFKPSGMCPIFKKYVIATETLGSIIFDLFWHVS